MYLWTIPQVHNAAPAKPVSSKKNGVPFKMVVPIALAFLSIPVFVLVILQVLRQLL